MSTERIAELTEGYPRFTDGRIDYSKERVCFVLNCVVVCGTEVLLTKRSADVIAYPNTINGISGFIDRTDVSLDMLVKQELSEELGAPLYKIIKLVISSPFVQVDEDINREWHVYAVLVEFAEKFAPVTNWENKEANWYTLEEAHTMKLMRGFPETLDIALALR